ncbi:MAG: VOC family protein [Pseudobdellovibrio sp.]|nr:VOC family protein [Pseudobdellovibrio sp.]
MAKKIPDGYSTITPYMVVNDVPTAIEFYKRAFGAEQLLRMDAPDGKVMHAEIKVGNSILMMTSEMDMGGMKSQGPLTLKGTPISFMMYVEDVDSAAKKAVDAGMKTLKPVENQFYGDRSGTFQDPFGHIWTIGTHVEDVPMELMKQKMNEMFSKGAKS